MPRSLRSSRMAKPISADQNAAAIPAPPRRARVAAAAGAAALGALLLLTALVLWFHYGTAVFFEMIASGFAACF